MKKEKLYMQTLAQCQQKKPMNVFERYEVCPHKQSGKDF